MRGYFVGRGFDAHRASSSTFSPMGSEAGCASNSLRASESKAGSWLVLAGWQGLVLLDHSLALVNFFKQALCFLAGQNWSGSKQIPHSLTHHVKLAVVRVSQGAGSSVWR